MSSYTTRVLLKGDPTSSEYEKLHAEMEKFGYSRTISSNEGNTYRLPNAEYNLSGSYTRSEALEFAKKAASSVSMGAEILVTESAGRTWSNLEKID